MIKSTLKFFVSHKIMAVTLAILMLFSASFAFTSMMRKERPLEKDGFCFYYERYNYYNDASHTTFVGTKAWYCDDTYAQSGIVTPYFDHLVCDCDQRIAK